MRIDRAYFVPLMIGVSVMLLGVAIYSPLMVAWLDRRADFGGIGIEVKLSWFMRRADFLYVPLTRFHAWMCGYYYVNSAQAEGEVTGLLFTKDEIYAPE